MPSKLEKDVESTVCKYARGKGFLTPKINVVGERGWPDRLFIDPDGWHVWIEFKAPGKPLQAIQIYRSGELIKRGTPCIVIDNVEYGKEVVDALVSARLSNEGNEPAVVTGVGGITPGPWTRKN